MSRSEAEKASNGAEKCALPVTEVCSTENGFHKPYIDYGNGSNGFMGESCTFTTSHSIIEMSVVYPQENPFNAVDDIVKAMAYVGLFDGVQK